MFRVTMPAALALLTLTTAVSAAESLSFRVPPGWTLGDQHEIPNQLSVLELVREGESVDDWTELVTIETMPRPRALPSASVFLQKLQGTRENRCPGVTAWRVLSEEKRKLVYEYSMTGSCGTWPRESEVGLIMLGKRDTWRLRYTTRAETMAEEARAEWIETFSTTHVKK